MYIKQISVFVENKPGRLYDISHVLAEKQIGINAFTVADTSDFGILRLITDDAEAALSVLTEHSFTTSVTHVIAIEVEDKPGGLANVLKKLSENQIAVEYMYPFLKQDGKGKLILKLSDMEKGLDVLNGAVVSL